MFNITHITTKSLQQVKVLAVKFGSLLMEGFIYALFGMMLITLIVVFYGWPLIVAKLLGW